MSMSCDFGASCIIRSCKFLIRYCLLCVAVHHFGGLLVSALLLQLKDPKTKDSEIWHVILTLVLICGDLRCMFMERSWINALRNTVEYDNGVNEFLEFAKRNVPDNNGLFFCPCVICLNMSKLTVEKIRDHLFWNGFYKGYTTWTWHGEIIDLSSVSQMEEADEVNTDEDRLEDMIRDIGPESFLQAHVYNSLCNDAETPLYPGCKYKRLSAVLDLINLKAKNGWSDKSFTELLELLKNILPEGNTLPKSNYEAKKILCPMGMEYKKIHACRNDCILYRKDYDELHECPICGTSRYKDKDGDSSCDVSIKRPPAKVAWYLPIIPRFKRFFANADDAKNFRWHSDERKRDGKIRHPADSLQWKKIDSMFPEFSNEPRNLRVALATDGMNPFGSLSSKHSSWPVFLIIYNLSPWLCMKRKYIMLSMMISGPKQPGNDIDVYLTPLIEDLKFLWDEGVDVFDGYRREYFRMRALLFCTINDFPAYGNLSGYSVKGHKACPICEDDTSHHQLTYGKKTVYLRHRRFLRQNHPYRRLRKAFNGFPENGVAPKPLTGEQIYQKVKDINVIFGKGRKNAIEKNIWKKMSIFNKLLPYWRILEVVHCVDMMHLEKNVGDSLSGTLLNILGKTKDGLNARLDMLEMGIREELAPQPRGKRTYLPPACHTLSTQEKRSVCECLHDVKVPSSYSSNFKKLVSMDGLKLVGLKSHDIHVLMQQLLPVAIRGILPKNVRYAITRLCFFFKDICSKEIDPRKLDELENDAATILCQLEMYFPPSFFDIMVHLIVHLVREIRWCGPIYLRWMYPIERYMKILKGYVKNQHRPEASIVEKYIAEEAIEFCTHYLSKVEPIGLPKSRHEGRIEGKGTHGMNIKSMGRKEVLQAHLYILNNIDEVKPYLSTHKKIIKDNNPRMNENRLLKEHNKTFLTWFEEQLLNDDNASDILKWLAYGPKFDVVCWNGYDINNLSFYTKSLDDKSTVQNSGVMVVAESMHFSGVKDKNPVMASSPYYGVIEEIWEVDYNKFRVPVFKCKWVDITSGVQIDELGFTMVDFNKIGHIEEPFVMASQATQVFYIKDPSNKELFVVLNGRGMPCVDEEIEDSTLDIFETSFSSRIPTFDEENEVDDVHATRHDHHEGIWENIPIPT